jgi:ribosome-associated protein
MTEEFEHYDDTPEELLKSKTRVKREMEALQDLGEKLTKLSKAQRQKIPMSDTLRDALVEADRIKQWGAKRRHLQYIGKVMRNEDAEAIQEKLDLFDTTSALHNKRFHQLEHTRDALIGENGNDVMAQYINDNPDIDIQALRQAIRSAQQEANKEGASTTARKKLFKLLREHQDRKLGLDI